MREDLETVANALTALMRRAAPGMAGRPAGARGVHPVADWATPRRPGQPMWFGGVQTMKNYVSYHLMPVYTHAALAARISPDLRKRMQGKSCFNFRAVDPVLFDELEALTREAAAAYARPFTLPVSPRGRGAP